jgi:hypothetical protein
MLMLTHWVSYFRRPSAPRNRSVRKVGASDVRDAAGEGGGGGGGGGGGVGVAAAAAAADAVEGAEEAVVVAENRIIR